MTTGLFFAACQNPEGWAAPRSTRKFGVTVPSVVLVTLTVTANRCWCIGPMLDDTYLSSSGAAVSEMPVTIAVASPSTAVTSWATEPAPVQRRFRRSDRFDREESDHGRLGKSTGIPVKLRARRRR